jgi:phospholipase C
VFATVPAAAFSLGAVLGRGAITSPRRTVALLPALPVLVGLSVVAGVAGAGAWSVDEPAPTDPRMIAGNGVVESVDTHAFLIARGAEILGNDGHTAQASFLAAPDPTAPMARDASGASTGVRESYLWRVQLGSRDADRVLKHRFMPDHFFNWWTHSGKGLVAGPSAATYAEEQFAQAVHAWRSGRRSTAMYHLGAATHLVDDACAPPHEFFLVPNHRAYEERMLAVQSTLSVHRGGIYQGDFRVDTGHGGPEWSSAHTRGWVDECAHRAAELVVNTAQPPPSDRAAMGRLDGTFAHFRDTQRLTAGYLQFFFDSVGGP